MRYRTFPGTAVAVSEIGFGTWTVSTGWWGEKTDAEAVRLLRRALDEFGVTFFDAADAYGNGRAERQLAEAFRGRRDAVVYATKVGYDIYDEAAQRARRGQSELPMRTDPASIRFAVDRCLERLETDHIDVLQIHNAKMEHVHDRELWDTLRALTAEGKVRVWGAAFGPAIGWLYEAVELCEREPDVGAIQNDLEYSGATSGDGDARCRASPRAQLRFHRPGSPRVGDAGGPVHRRHGIPRERSPASSPSVVARQRTEKDSNAGFSDD